MQRKGYGAMVAAPGHNIYNKDVIEILNILYTDFLQQQHIYCEQQISKMWNIFKIHRKGERLHYTRLVNNAANAIYWHFYANIFLLQPK